MAVIKMDRISKIYNHGKANECQALRDVSVEIQKGEWVAVTGKSGSGKSTFLHIAGLADKYTSGELIFDGVSMSRKNQRFLAKSRQEKIGFVLQDFGLLWNLSVFDNIATPLYMNHVKAAERKLLVQQAAEQLGIADLLSKKAKELSGGQCQRVAIARAVIKNPAVILADEPTGALDRKTADQVMEIFEKINGNGTTVVMVTHDIEIAERCKRKIVIEDGRIV